MITGHNEISNMQERIRIYSLLSICSLLSSGLGVLYSAAQNHSYFSMMRMAAGRPVSIVGSLVAVFLPYFVSVLVITNSKYKATYILCAFRIFHFAATLFTIARTFGSAGMLISFMLLFPDFALIPMLLVIFLRKFLGVSHKYDKVFGLFLTAIVGVINHCAVSPFLAMIITIFETNG